MPIIRKDIRILCMKGPAVKDFHCGDMVKSLCEDFNGKGGGSDRYGGGVIYSYEFMCDTCNRELVKGDKWIQNNNTGKLWCEKCWDKNGHVTQTGRVADL